MLHEALHLHTLHWKGERKKKYGFYDFLVSTESLRQAFKTWTYRKEFHLLSGRMLVGKLKHEQQIPDSSIYNSNWHMPTYITPEKF